MQKLRSWSSEYSHILLISIFILFTELFLIRWISTEIRIFAYVNNLVLLACFVGLGLGSLLDKRFGNLLYSVISIFLLALASTSNHFLNITEQIGSFSDQLIWYLDDQPINWIQPVRGILSTLLLFAFIVAVFIPPGQILARLLSSAKNITLGYSVNIFGSIVGIWLFSTISFLFLPPAVWLALSLILSWKFIQPIKWERTVFFCSSLITVFLLLPHTSSLQIWSPYQKLDMRPAQIRNTNITNGYIINVNNVGYQKLIDLSDRFFEKNATPEINSVKHLNQYELPYLIKGEVKDALIVGAGAGNGPAGAIRQGVERIDAVEIDPGIYELGTRYHPESPYDNERVRVHIDDARSFFKKSKQKYDVVSFGLVDAHSTASSFNNIRLDHYVYTEESIQDARKLLKPDGILTLIFAPHGRGWLISRLHNIIEKVFGHSPLVFEVPTVPYSGWGGSMFVVSNDGTDPRLLIEKRPDVKSYISPKIFSAKQESDIRNTTDDWPYLYLVKNRIPKMHLLITFCLLILLVPTRKILTITKKSFDFHFFFLGAGFLLLEFQNISKASLFFGSTWLVNAYMFSAILGLILLANWASYLGLSKHIGIVYCLQWICILALFLLPLDTFRGMGHLFNATVLSTLLNIPVFFAGLIFMHSFARVKDKPLALGSNLLGACVGGLLESASFVVGIKALLLFVLAFYVLAYFSFNRSGLARAPVDQVSIFLSNLCMVPRARLGC